jgi:hypothetical protein
MNAETEEKAEGQRLKAKVQTEPSAFSLWPSAFSSGFILHLSSSNLQPSPP